MQYLLSEEEYEGMKDQIEFAKQNSKDKIQK